MSVNADSNSRRADWTQCVRCSNVLGLYQTQLSAPSSVEFRLDGYLLVQWQVCVMKANVATVFLLLILSATVAIGQNQNPPFYPFARYPAEPLYKGKPVAPKLITPTQRQFRTVLRKGRGKGPNFAGHYTVVEWGCGSNCVSFTVVDAVNGKVYDTDMPPLNDEYPCGLLYKLESRLFVVAKSSSGNGDCKAHLYIWDGSRFKPVHDSTPVHQTMTFTAADGSFQFSHPNDFQVCTQGKIEPCIQSYIPVCEQDALVCVIYPAKQSEDTSFGGASFQVREIVSKREAMTADVCVTPYPRKDPGGISDWPEFLVSAEHPQEMIGGILFLHGVNGGVATSHSIAVDLYRSFHKQRCFELSVSQTQTDPNVSEPPMKTLTPAQQKELDQSMSQILHSFRFSK